MHCARCAIIVITIVTVAYMHQETALAMPCRDSPYSVVVWQVPEAAMLRASPKSIL